MTKEEASKLFKILTDEVNLECVRLLVESSEMCFCDFEEKFSDLEPQEIVDHLQVLLDNGFLNAYEVDNSEELLFEPNKDTIGELMSYVYSDGLDKPKEEHECCCGHHHKHHHHHEGECCCGEEGEEEHECCCSEVNAGKKECCCEDDDCCSDNEEDELIFQGDGADLEPGDNPEDPYNVSK